MNIKVIDGTTTIINDQQIKNIDQRNKHRMRCRNRTPQGTQTIKKIISANRTNTEYVVETEHPEVTDINTAISLKYGSNYKLIEINLEDLILHFV